MAEMVTKQELANAKIDAKDLGDAINEKKTVTPRYGAPFKTVPLVIEELNTKANEVIAQGFYKGFATEALLLAAKPTVSEMRARADDTRKIWRWNRASAEGVTPVTGTWSDTGLSDFDQAKNYSDENAIFNPKLISSSAAIDLNTLSTFGFHRISAQNAWDATLNKPPSFVGHWAVILVLPLSATAFFQLFYSLSDKKIAFRVRTTSTTISDWVDLVNTQSLNEILNTFAIFNPKSVSTTTGVDFNILNTFGFHKFVSANAWNNSTNKPTLTDQWAFALILPISTSVIFQFVFCINANVLYFRSSTSTTAWGQWKKITGDDAVLAAAAAAATSVITNELMAFSSNILPSKIDEKLKPEFEIGSKNILDPDKIVLGKVVSSTGLIVDKVNGVITGNFSVKDKLSIAVSGLQPSVAYRAIVFRDLNNTVVNVQSIAPNLTEKVFLISPNLAAVTAQLCLKENSDTFTLDTSLIQIEYGTLVTAYEPFKRGALKTIYGVELSGSNSIKSRAFGASYLLFGDSITETSNVDNGIFNQTSYRKNWPTWAYETLRMATFRNYAKSGAAFKDRSLEPRYQYLYNQVIDAIANNEKPDVIVVACGTNDGMGKVGTYEAAMLKTTLESLDQTTTLEAARWVFWKLRVQYPDAVCFFANPLQRMANTTEELAPMVDGLSKLAQRHGFLLIDQNKESGIIRELEVLSSAGKYLADGLHPNDLGRQRQANLIVSKIISYMAY